MKKQNKKGDTFNRLKDAGKNDGQNGGFPDNSLCLPWSFLDADMK